MGSNNILLEEIWKNWSTKILDVLIKNECQIWNYHTKIGVENFELIEEEIPTEKTLSSVNVVVY